MSCPKAHHPVRRAFTLVEILIVVVILGVLAAIVLPQFANASLDARKTNMASQLQTLRSAVELYRLQHRDQTPKLLTGGGWTVFTSRTTQDGVIDNAAGQYGPYLSDVPVNPLTQSSAIVEVGSAAAIPAPGWFYDEETGELHGANSEGEQSDSGT